MSNPVFTRSKAFQERTPAGYPQMPGYQPGMSQAPANEYRSDLNQPTTQPVQMSPYPAADAPAGTGQASRPVTYDDVLIKTAMCFALLLGGAAVSWFVTQSNPSLGYGLMLVGVLVALVLGLINAFKQQPSPALILGYAVFEGLALGAISRIFEARVGGVVGQAIMATLVTFAVMLVLFKTKMVRNSPTLMRVVMIGSFAYIGFYLVSWITGMFSSSGGIAQATVFGIPLWVIVSVLAVVLASLSLITDFDYITKAVENQAPAETAWTAAWGLMVSLVWLYLELLRLLAYFQQD